MLTVTLIRIATLFGIWLQQDIAILVLLRTQTHKAHSGTYHSAMNGIRVMAILVYTEMKVLLLIHHD